MKASEAQALANQLMKQYLSPDWHFMWMNTKRSCARCSFRFRLIELNSTYIQFAPDDDIKNSILHEIAHAIAGPAAGHGWAWKIACRQVGCAGDRLARGEHIDNFVMSQAKYVADCPCGVPHIRNRKATGIYTCSQCKTPLTWRLNKPTRLAAQNTPITRTESPRMPEPTPYVAPPTNQPDPQWLKEKREAEIRLKKMVEDI